MTFVQYWVVALTMLSSLGNCKHRKTGRQQQNVKTETTQISSDYKGDDDKDDNDENDNHHH